MENSTELIHQTFVKYGWTLSLAESCTGGAIAARLTKKAGCSAYFLGSIVAYSNTLKIKILRVNDDLLQKFGAVSREVVKEMGVNVKELTGSHYSIAVSGIAGPGGGTPNKPVGLIWAAICGPDLAEPYVWSFQLTGNREQIIEEAVNNVLNQLWMLIKTKVKCMP